MSVEPSISRSDADGQSAVDRGFAFAEELHELVGRLGPPELSAAENEVFASHLVAVAVEWVRSRNRAKAEGRS